MPPLEGAWDDLPSIRIDRTAANDLYLMARLLLPSRQLGAVLADPVEVGARHLPELDMAAGLIRARIEGAVPEHEQPEDGRAPVDPPPRSPRRIEPLLR